jgi:hypothetical protein
MPRVAELPDPLVAAIATRWQFSAGEKRIPSGRRSLQGGGHAV